MTTTMTAAEFRAIRAGLGVTAEWVADHVGVRVRAVQRWESGVSQMKPGVIEAILMLEAQAADQVAEEVETMSGSRMPVFVIEDNGGDDAWPAGWQRQIAFRVRQQVSGVRIVDVAEPVP
ncbi:MAG: helix-turn-helix domain-containing protein [Rhodococcus sp.]|nr:helix-turn-helix domain-containing protein [Rhodococcus sp. (in: high G+C Gram-positive bacteria)]